jgi:hypothetical protein
MVACENQDQKSDRMKGEGPDGNTEGSSISPLAPNVRVGRPCSL